MEALLCEVEVAKIISSWLEVVESLRRSRKGIFAEMIVHSTELSLGLYLISIKLS